MNWLVRGILNVFKTGGIVLFAIITIIFLLCLLSYAIGGILLVFALLSDGYYLWAFGAFILLIISWGIVGNMDNDDSGMI